MISMRQGGSATAWNVKGTTNYDVTRLAQIRQNGATESSGGTPNKVSVTFPHSFTNTPIVHVTVYTNDESGSINATIKNASDTGFDVCVSGTVARTVLWTAEGEIDSISEAL
jgi:hypothetical protein